MKRRFSSFFKHLKYGDFLVVLFALLLGSGLFINNFLSASQGSSAQIIIGSIVLLDISLDTGRIEYEEEKLESLVSDFNVEDLGDTKIISFVSSDIYLEIGWEQGKIGFVKSECHDKICVKTGFIQSSGQVAACIPAGVLLKVSSESSEEEADIIIS